MRVQVNTVIIGGNLTRPCTVKYTGKGTPVCELSVAINEQSGRGENAKEITTYVDVTVWGKSAEAAGQYLDKGSPVLIEGRLHTQSWETKDGKKRSKLTVTAYRVHFLGDSNRSEREQEVERQVHPDYENESQEAPSRGDDDSLPF